MSSANFSDALKLVLIHEGGFSDHPDDPGGATMKGVTQSTYDAYRTDKGLPTRSVRQITDAELQAIYRLRYWDVVKGDKLPAGVDYCVFDYAVNSGPAKAVKDLQRALGCKVDGIAGLITLRAAGEADPERLIEDLCDRRLAFLKTLKTWKTFGKGWAKRVENVRRQAIGMLSDEVALTSAVAEAEIPLTVLPKAEKSQQAQLKTADGAGISATTVGGVGQTAMERAQDIQPHIGDTILGRAAIAAFVLLMAFGISLLIYAQLKRIREAGGLGGYVGSVFR